MRLACPSCRAVYEIPDALIGGSRRLRCARCPTEWVAPAQSDKPAGGLAATSLIERAASEPALHREGAVNTAGGPNHENAPVASVRVDAQPPLVSGLRPEPRPTATVAPRRRARALTTVLAWLLTFAILGAGAASCYRWRGEVMAAWPPSQRVYAALGLH